MTDHWRSKDRAELPERAWFRGRWIKGTIKVIDGDLILTDRFYANGALVELKHVEAKDKTWALTRHMAQRLGWWAALIEHDSSGAPQFWTVLPPSAPISGRLPFGEAAFDGWVAREFGAQRRENGE